MEHIVAGQSGVWRAGYNNSSVLVCFESERNVVILPMMTNVKECRIFLSSLPSHLFEKYNNNASQTRLSKLDLPPRRNSFLSLRDAPRALEMVIFLLKIMTF
jgi:hypothetical protein